ncbi:hypothetical protein DL96DRAFT_1823181 [Flagelloscypha sp. PMI_526]|nr:hypothetical protein DL96DRAFT_1823181 [Flagelloscypha sp. PMI_526]
MQVKVIFSIILGAIALGVTAAPVPALEIEAREPSPDPSCAGTTSLYYSQPHAILALISVQLYSSLDSGLEFRLAWLPDSLLLPYLPFLLVT